MSAPQGQFFLEFSPDQILVGNGTWVEKSSSSPPLPSQEWQATLFHFHQQAPWHFEATDWQVMSRQQLIRFQEKTTHKSPFSSYVRNLEWKMSPFEKFEASFQSLQKLIQEGHLIKGVPWGYSWANWPTHLAPELLAESFFPQLFESLVQIPLNLVVYGLRKNNLHIVGASPEWLFRLEAGGKKLHTMAMASTRWSEQNHPAPSQKERDEHQWVVEAIVQKLSRFGKVTTGLADWVTAGHLYHLKTPITLEADQKLDPTAMVELLHPTPAVGVFPQNEKGKKWLAELPFEQERMTYASPWCVTHSSGAAWALVGLRQIQMHTSDKQKKIFIPAGCGVVKDSTLSLEWEEIREKIRSVKQLWRLN